MDSKESLKNNQLKVSLCITEEPDFTTAQEMDYKLKNSYLSLKDSACQLAISNYVFSRITGTLFVQTRNQDGLMKTANIGLNLKFSKKNQETPGYTKKFDTTWCYSMKAVDLVREYITKFPEILKCLSNNNFNDELLADNIFHNE